MRNLFNSAVVVLGLLAVVSMASADSVVYESGYSYDAPAGFEVIVVPEGFNTGAYVPGNITGMAADGSFPLLDAFCAGFFGPEFADSPSCDYERVLSDSLEPTDPCEVPLRDDGAFGWDDWSRKALGCEE